MTRPLRVLVVDDNPGFVDNMHEILTDAGYAPVGVSSAAAARDEAAKGFDLAIIDMKLPDDVGTELAVTLKTINPDAAVIMLTGYSTVETAAAAVRAGAFAYMSKPAATPNLLLTLEQAGRQVRLQADKHELARRVQTAEKLAAIGTLTAGLSHEIRNPLNAAGLQLQVLERRIEQVNPEELRATLLKPLSLVRNEIRRLDRLLEDFLQFSRPRELKSERVELPTLISNIVELLEKNAETSKITLVKRLAAHAAVNGDDARLRQAVMNLALNAIQASPGGTVTFGVEPSINQVQLTVDDTGPGVPRELRDRIFEPFFTTKSGGTGLGLPLVHSIVTQHGGSITVADSPAGGARFTVTLPLAR